uniref:UPF3 domain-containing protein n=2 Tax=Clytia hemisphaerica TaxID=252671 RepID=A0A7M5V9A7_9CNID
MGKLASDTTVDQKPKEKPKTKKEKHMYPRKLVIRRLPTSLNEETLKEELGNIPEYEYFYFTTGDTSFGMQPYSRAYISFKNYDDVYDFRNKFDGHLFYDTTGREFSAVVEFAPCQLVPKERQKKDHKTGTLEKDPEFIQFLESLDKEEEKLPSAEIYIEEIEAAKAIDKNKVKFTTPLIDYLKEKRDVRLAAIAQKEKERKEREQKRREQRDKKQNKHEEQRSERKSADKSSNRDSKKNEERKDKYKDKEKEEINSKSDKRKDKKDNNTKQQDRSSSASNNSKDKDDHREKEKKERLGEGGGGGGGGGGKRGPRERASDRKKGRNNNDNRQNEQRSSSSAKNEKYPSSSKDQSKDTTKDKSSSSSSSNKDSSKDSSKKENRRLTPPEKGSRGESPEKSAKKDKRNKERDTSDDTPTSSSTTASQSASQSASKDNTPEDGNSSEKASPNKNNRKPRPEMKIYRPPSERPSSASSKNVTLSSEKDFGKPNTTVCSFVLFWLKATI